MRFVYLETALDDLVWFHHYYKRVFSVGDTNAKKQFDSIQSLLLENPHFGHPTHVKGVREFSIPKIPFSFIYQIKSDEIQVLRVWDERQDRAKLD